MASSSQTGSLPRLRPEQVQALYSDLTPGAMDAARAVIAGQIVPDVCPMCKNIGEVLRAPENLDEMGGYYQKKLKVSDLRVPCPICGKEKRIEWLASNSGLEGGELDKRMHHFQAIQFKADGEKLTSKQARDMTAQRRQAKAMIERAIREKHGLYTFWGDFGSGKSLALQIVVNEVRVLSLREGYYASFASIINHLRSLFSQGAEASTYWERLLRIPVLALDEVTRFDERGWIRDRLFVLVDTRYRLKESHLTVFATNDDPRKALPPDEPIGYLFSRMREGSLRELRGDVRSAVAA